ncbi:MAG: 6-bladed beta-propeller, partial [Gammaproteobacteria bacterium]|nr:6-bladed beta-propeller [Gammaproteobacteria bacterium]
MRRIIVSSLALFLFACASAPELPPSAALVGVDFIGDIPTGKKSTRLLNWGDGRLYLAQEDGSVLIINDAGETISSLPTKDSKGKELLRRPEALTIADNTIYVVDSGTQQVVMYSMEGEVKGTFGGGDGYIRLSSPKGIAAHDGIIYVADSGNNLIRLYGVNGVYLSSLNISQNPYNKKKFADKGLPFELSQPVDIEIDPIGRIYALDSSDYKIKVYDQRGRYQNTLPKSGESVDLTISKTGIYVANRSSYTINQYSFEHRLTSTFGSKGKGKAQFQSLTGLVANGDKGLFVGDRERHSIHQFSTKAAKPLSIKGRLATIDSVRWLGETKARVGKLAWNGDDNLYAIDDEKKSILKIRNGKIIQELKINNVTPLSIAISPEGNPWIIDGEKKRIIKIDANGKVLSKFGSAEGLFSFVSGDSGAGKFDEPTDIAISSKGFIFVSDQDNHWIQVFNGEGVFINAIRKTTNKEKPLDEPTAIALDPYDNLYVIDKSQNSIFIYNANGEPKGQISNSDNGDSPGNLKAPQDLMANNSEILVLDDNRIKIYDLKGRYLRSVGGEGSGVGQFRKPIAISAKDGDTYTISDSENGRLQTLTTLRKPAAPSSVMAEGGMHAVTLTWKGSTLPYVDHYQLYRSESAEGPFSKIAQSKETQYLDKNLDANRSYYYLVSAASHQGYESTLDLLVDAETTQYTPPKLSGVEAIPAAWQLQLKWQPLDERYSSSYLIYKKNGELFAKIGATDEANYQIRSLDPDTDYTFYVSAISSDGIESEKVAATATTLVATTTPLELDIIEMSDVFSNTYKIYEENGIGRIKLTNNTGDNMQNIKIGFTLKNFMDFPTGSQIDQLAPGESREITLKAVFNNNILNVTEDTPVQTELTASYFVNNTEKVFSKNHAINVYEKHRLSWDDHDRFASFITPKDPLLINYVRSIATQYKETKIKAQWAAAVFNSLGVLGLTYIQDPTNPYQVTSGKTDFVDYIQYPRETLERKSGDCDDLVALYSASLESLGVETRVVEVPGHMLMMFNTGIQADADGYTMDDMYVIHEDMLWIPVETTVVGNSFLKAWEMGSQNYYKWKDQGLSLLNIQESWRTYKPASLPQSTWKPTAVSKENIETNYPGEYM